MVLRLVRHWRLSGEFVLHFRDLYPPHALKKV
jgi:hypothetical protein